MTDRALTNAVGLLLISIKTVVIRKELADRQARVYDKISFWGDFGSAPEKKYFLFLKACDNRCKYFPGYRLSCGMLAEVCQDVRIPAFRINAGHGHYFLLQR